MIAKVCAVAGDPLAIMVVKSTILAHSMSFSLCSLPIQAYGRAGAGWRMEPNKMTGKSGDLSQIYFLILVGTE
jgi:hypothetical protein